MRLKKNILSLAIRFRKCESGEWVSTNKAAFELMTWSYVTCSIPIVEYKASRAYQQYKMEHAKSKQ